MKRIDSYLALILVGALLFITGCGNSVEEEFFEVNDWIRTSMQENYLWNENVPANTDGSILPNAYFGSMLNDDDIFSYITEFASGFTITEELNISSGVSPTFIRFTGSSFVFAVIEFVYPGSPADSAGLKRGDIILNVNGSILNTSNFIRLFFRTEGIVTYSLGEYDPNLNVINETSETVRVRQQVLDLNPLIESKVFQDENTNIDTGYIFFGEFNDGNNDRYIDSVDAAFNFLKSENIEELIIDLRYSRGGSFKAVANVANAIVPTENAENNDIFVNFLYNEIIRQSIINEEGNNSDSLLIKFSPHSENLNLQRVYFLTSSQTSSSAEMLIKGLSPYLNVIIIGEETAGEQFGSKVIYGENANPKNEFLIAPVFQQAVSSIDDGSFSTPVNPDIIFNENLLTVFQVGDDNDPFIRAALQDINGFSSNDKFRNHSDFTYEILRNEMFKQTGRLWFN